MKSRTPLLVVLAAGLASPVQAMDGNEVMNHCKHSINAFGIEGTSDFGISDYTHTGFCNGLIFGIQDTLIQETHSGYYPNWCPPQMSNIQAVRIVYKFLESNPARLHEDGVALAMEALLEAFPCEDVQ